MPEARRLSLFTSPPHRPFGDALAAGLIARHGGDPLGLARGAVLLPNARAVRSVTEAFVRASGGGLLLPRLVAIGDPDLGETLGAGLDPLDEALPPPIDPVLRRMELARLIELARERQGERIAADEAVRLAGDLARVIDQLTVEQVPASALRDLPLAAELSQHWQVSLQLLEIAYAYWPARLAELGRSDLQAYRNHQLDTLAARWRDAPPPGWVVAAGIDATAPAAARLLRTIAGMAGGAVVFAGLDLAMPPDEWDALGPHAPDPVSGRAPRAIETHPQFHLKLLLDRMGVGRGEFVPWRHGADAAPPRRSDSIASALRPPAYTGAWVDPGRRDLGLAGVRLATFETPADEAQGIALALRGVLEVPGRTAALVTPDRALGARVAAHLERWGVAIDDSAGRPLSTTAAGTLPLLLADAAAGGFAPAALLALLGHPLVRAGEGRGAWLSQVRAADRRLRGPRPAPGLAAAGAMLGSAMADWWGEVSALLGPLEAPFAARTIEPAAAMALIRAGVEALAGDAAWAGPAGRQAAEVFAEVEPAIPHGAQRLAPTGVAPLLRTLFDEVAVRPPQGGHPRIAILGLVEARLQGADLIVVAGLNEGVWPGLPAPDPWLAPRIRAELGLPGLERRIGVAAHDFAHALGAQEVLLTRAARDASAPTVASRFLLRLQAMAGPDLAADRDLPRLARLIDAPTGVAPAPRPRPAPPAADRPRRISVTEVDTLKADPFAFYAKRMLGLAALDAVDADASAAWRGTEVHRVLEHWARQDRCDPARLIPRAEAMLADAGTHPLTRALWSPRLVMALEWVAAETAARMAEGHAVLAAEEQGTIDFAGVALRGKFDRVDRRPDGTLGIVDYKTGQPPGNRAVAAGYALQLGLIGLIAERGGFAAVAGTCGGFEYWSLARDGDGFGRRVSPVEGRTAACAPEDFVALAAETFAAAVGRWLTGSDAFVAKLHPEYAPYADYDQLMRRDEWYGRG